MSLYHENMQSPASKQAASSKLLTQRLACRQEHFACDQPECELSFVAFSSPQGLAAHMHRQHGFMPGRDRRGKPWLPHLLGWRVWALLL